MNGNTNDLILNLTRNAPWLIDDEKDVFPEVIPDDTGKILAEAGDNRLIIITESGQVYECHQSLAIIGGKIQLYKPLGWRDQTESFYLFFRNSQGYWNYFPANSAETSPSAIPITKPDNVFRMQKRRYQRVVAPLGAKAIFTGHDSRMNSAHVQDISEGGMLIFHNSMKAKFPVDSVINDICITIPSVAKKNPATVVRRITPLISKGKVVRTFYDHERYISYSGVSFFYKSAYVKERVNHLVKMLKSPEG